MAAHKEWLSNPEHLVKEGEYKDIVERSCSELDGAEKTLIEQMSLQRERYMREHVEPRIKEFWEDLLEEKLTAEEQHVAVWRNIERRINDIVSDFTLQYVVVFGNDCLKGKDDSLLNVMAKSENLPDKLRKQIDSGQLRFKMSKVPGDIQHKWITSAEDKRILDAIEGFPGKLSGERNLIRVLPVPFSHKHRSLF